MRLMVDRFERIGICALRIQEGNYGAKGHSPDAHHSRVVFREDGHRRIGIRIYDEIAAGRQRKEKEHVTA